MGAQRDRTQQEDSFWIQEFLRTGEKEYWGRIYEKYKKPIFLQCLRVVKHVEDAKDLTSETFIKAFEKLDRYDPDRPIFPWLSRVAVNLCIDHVRKKVRIKTEEFDEQTTRADFDNGPAEVQSQVPPEEIFAALRRLKRPQRRCFCLFYIHGKSYKEIAQLTGYPLGQVRSHIQNGRRRFRLLLERPRKRLSGRLALGTDPGSSE